MSVDPLADDRISAPLILNGLPAPAWRRRWSGLSLLAPPLVWLCSAAFPAAAQGLNPGAVTEDRPVAISAASGIEWQQDAQVYIARGNAVAKRGTTEVYADTLTAHYRPSKTAGSDTEIYRLDADGHVTIKGETQTVVGDQAVWDVDQQTGIVTGKALKLTTPTDVVTARDSLEWYDQKQIAVARGDAVAVKENVKRIRADVLTAHMTKAKAGRDQSPGPAGKACAVPGGNEAGRRGGAAWCERRKFPDQPRRCARQCPRLDPNRHRPRGLRRLQRRYRPRHPARQCYDHARRECDQRSIRRHGSEQQRQPHAAHGRQPGIPGIPRRRIVRPAGSTGRTAGA